MIRVFEKGKAFEFYPQALCYLPLLAFSFKMNFEGLTLHYSFKTKNRKGLTITGN